MHANMHEKCLKYARKLTEYATLNEFFLFCKYYSFRFKYFVSKYLSYLCFTLLCMYLFNLLLFDKIKKLLNFIFFIKKSAYIYRKLSIDRC